MELLTTIITQIRDIISGPVLMILLPSIGIYLTLGLRLLPWRRIGTGFKNLWQGRRAQNEEGDISPFQALMTALAATIGTGNIAGVGTAIFIGGPGAIFWMWLIALFGMATKYAEAVLAVHYRETDVRGMHVGGPMYYIKNGLSGRWQWLGWLFAAFGMSAAFGLGNTVQSNSVAHSVEASLGIAPWISGLVMAVIAGAVILGGIKRIGQVADKFVPLMAIIYVLGALVIIVMNITQVPAALGLIIHDAFTGTAASGGFLGASVWLALQNGVARGIFSNEAGLGSAPIAHAAARTNDPIRQGTIAMLGTFIDTLVICTMTALVIILSGAWTGGATGAQLTGQAFNLGLGGFGDLIVTFGLILFAFTTLIGWSYYGERCAEYVLGVRAILPYRLLWIIAIPLGALAAGEDANVKLLWYLADTLNALMALPNLIALAALSPVVFQLTREYLEREKHTGKTQA